jgi:pimeloyl-ACP methyl ester carboxylesterase
VLFPGFGHGVNLTAPERCVAEIRKFLSTSVRRES